MGVGWLHKGASGVVTQGHDEAENRQSHCGLNSFLDIKRGNSIMGPLSYRSLEVNYKKI